MTEYTFLRWDNKITLNFILAFLHSFVFWSNFNSFLFQAGQHKPDHLGQCASSAAEGEARGGEGGEGEHLQVGGEGEDGGVDEDEGGAADQQES